MKEFLCTCYQIKYTQPTAARKAFDLHWTHGQGTDVYLIDCTITLPPTLMLNISSSGEGVNPSPVPDTALIPTVDV